MSPELKTWPGGLIQVQSNFRTHLHFEGNHYMCNISKRKENLRFLPVFSQHCLTVREARRSGDNFGCLRSCFIRCCC